MKKTAYLSLAWVVVVMMAWMGLSVATADARSPQCRADREKFCAQSQGRKAVRQCMRQNFAELSPACQQWTQQKIKHRQKKKRRACREDVQRFCSQVGQDKAKKKGAVLACLQANRSQLASACQRRVEVRTQRMVLRDSCQKDREKYCGSVKPGQGRIIACMKANQDQLSERCQKARSDFHTWKQQRRVAVNKAKAELSPWQSMNSVMARP